MQLGLQKIATRVPDVGQLKKICRRQQNLNVFLRNVNLRWVHVIYQQFQGRVVDTLQLNALLITLPEAREHRVEVGTARGEDHLVRRYVRPEIGDQGNVAQKVLPALNHFFLLN